MSFDLIPLAVSLNMLMYQEVWASFAWYSFQQKLYNDLENLVKSFQVTSTLLEMATMNGVTPVKTVEENS